MTYSAPQSEANVRPQKPSMQIEATHAERVFEVLVRASPETIDGNAEAKHAQFGHGEALCSGGAERSKTVGAEEVESSSRPFLPLRQKTSGCFSIPLLKNCAS
jgi:hypothetical protein